MTLSFGGVGIMSMRRPLSEWSDTLIGKGEIRTMFCALVSFLVVLVLAYLTNPSETSFRTYLTEQSFRQHLSQLDDSADDRQDQNNSKANYSSTSTTSRFTRHPADTGNSPFHFANRASVSLRTPKHVFHTFGIFTIAAVVPAARYRCIAIGTGNDRDGPMIADSWFIGAFGKWWRGGVIEAWYRDIICGTKDEEGWSSGILGIKALDQRNEFNGLPFSTTSPRMLARGEPPRLRNRDRSSQRNGTPTGRDSSPPPLPKSASLPLHTTRPTKSDQKHAQSDRPPSNGHHIKPQPVVSISSPLHSRTPSALFEQSPLIADVLRQISLSKTLVHDLRTQLTDFQHAASESHLSLQNEVESYREKKRQEDSSRTELKSQTKALEDSKRAAESTKRDAEKKLKAAQSARDDAGQRMVYLDKEIGQLQQRLSDDASSAQQVKADAAKEEAEICEALDYKKREIRVAEDVVAALNARTRELEERISGEKERLRKAREQAEIRKQDQSFYPMQVVGQESNAWAPIAYGEEYLDRELQPPVDPSRHRIDSIESLEHKSPKPPKLTLGSLSNFSPKTAETNHLALRSKGYSIFDDDLASLAQSQTTNFSPFADNDAPRTGDSLSPMSSALIPSSLIQSLDGRSSENLSRSFQSESDAFVDPDWRRSSFNAAPTPLYDTPASHLSASPTSITGPSFNDSDSKFGMHQFAPESTYAPFEYLQRRTHSDPSTHDHSPSHNYVDGDRLSIGKSVPRRWFSTLSKEKPRKGLNPDAKVFSLKKSEAQGPFDASGGYDGGSSFDGGHSYDALNPTGLGPHIMSAAPSTNTSLLRAFAPSPAEREVLQRVLGGSTNTSYERLPSLSDVSSIPSSPAHVHAVAAHQNHLQHHRPPPSQHGSVLPAWLHSLPFRKSNFRPWDDEEPAGPGA